MIKSTKFLRYMPLILLVAATGIACTGAGAQETTDDDVKADAGGVMQTQSGEVSCEMTFSMKGWSAIVIKAEGEGMVTCDNGQTEAVVLAISGGGVTFGKTTVDEGKGVFSDVADISEVFGSYAQASASAGVGDDSVGAQAMTKGDVSLTITTEGRGWTLGISGAEFSITRPVATGAGS